MNLIQAHIIFLNKLLLDELLVIIKNTINFKLLINTQNIKFNSYFYLNDFLNMK
jgi:hypothetical protein